MKTIKLTKFEASELQYKIEVLRDSGSEMWECIHYTEEELEILKSRIIPLKSIELSDKDYQLLKEESENLLDIAESNYEHGFGEYRQEVYKLRKLYAKFQDKES